MITHIAAYAAILIGCAYLGALFASKFKKRVEQLTELKCALAQLEFDIDFLNTPIYESLEKAAERSSGGVALVFAYIARRLRDERCVNMGKLWMRAVRLYRTELFLSDEDIKILTDFAENLGCGNREKEMNNIKAAVMRLGVAENEARTAASGGVRMYRGLGILCGVFLVIVLL